MIETSLMRLKEREPFYLVSFKLFPVSTHNNLITKCHVPGQYNSSGFWEQSSVLWQIRIWLSLEEKIQQNSLPSWPASVTGLKRGCWCGFGSSLFVFIQQKLVGKKLIWSCQDYICQIHIKMFSYVILFKSEYNNVIILTWKRCVL